MNLSENSKKLIELIESEGFEAYAVGGCVRDFLLNRACDDYDITSSATPYELENLLADNGIRYIETGLKHGTITALFNGESIEVTTFRTDGEYTDTRHPESVCFVRELDEDLSRRDFTVNALAYNERQGVVDLFGGINDINDKIIRTVGSPEKRFNEDALRIMRALRFSSVLGFEIEEKTKEAVFKNKDLLLNVSSERIYAELIKLLSGDSVFEVLTEYRDVIAVILPEVKKCFDFPQNNKWHIYNVWEHICHSVERSPKNEIIRLSMLLHDIGKPYCKTTDDRGCDHFYGHQEISFQLAEGALTRLKVSNKVFESVTTLVKYHDLDLYADKKNIRKWMSKLGDDIIRLLVSVKRADLLAQNPKLTNYELEEIDKIELLIEEIMSEREPFSVKDLAVNGFDIMALGIKGKAIGDTLDKLIDLVIEEKLENKKEILLNYVKEAASH